MSTPLAAADRSARGGPESSAPVTAGSGQAVSLGRAVIPVTQDSGPEAEASGAVLVTTMARSPGFGLSGWVDHLLALVLCHLGPGDLARCSRVCQQWHRVCCDPLLQARALMACYPPAHRRRLCQALAPERARQCLAPWCDTGRSGAVRIQADPGPLAGPGPDPALTFRRLVRQMIAAPAFSQWRQDQVYQSHPAGWLVCSRDSRLIACAHEFVRGTVTLYQLGDRGLSALFSHSYTGRIRALMFSEDSRVLQTLGNDALLRTWYREADSGRWCEAARGLLCDRWVREVQRSSDGRYLAVATEDDIRVFLQTAAMHWQPQWVWPWKQSLRRCATWRARPLQAIQLHRLVFSDNSEHLLLDVGMGSWFRERQETFLAHRTGAVWQEQSLCNEQGLEEDNRWQRGGILEAAGRFLALALDGSQHACAIAASQVRVSLYRFVAQQGWRLVTRRLVINSDPIEPFPMAFSHAGPQLVFPQRQSRRDSSLCVLSADSRTPWQQEQILPFVPASLAPVRGQRGSIEWLTFSSNGHFLAAQAEVGTHIWRRDRQSGWRSLRWIAGGYGALYRDLFFFAPDGCHCVQGACHLAGPGRINLWGPGDDGCYTRKMALFYREAPESIGFTPDGCRLLLRFRQEGGLSSLVCLSLQPGRPVLPHKRCLGRRMGRGGRSDS